MIAIPWYAFLGAGEMFPTCVTTDAGRVRRLLAHAESGAVVLVAVCRPGEMPAPWRPDSTSWDLWCAVGAGGELIPPFEPVPVSTVPRWPVSIADLSRAGRC